jgi:IclR family acetate operon transcriptional repressor
VTAEGALPVRGTKRGRARGEAAPAPTRTLDRGLVLLELLADRREATLTELAREADLSPSTALRLLETLRARGFVAHDQRTGVYVVGTRAFSVGAAAVRSGRLDRIALTAMRELSAGLGETVSLGVPEGGHVIYIEQIEGAAAVRMSWRLGARLPLHATAAGKVLLAWMWEAAVDARMGQPPFAALTPRTITDRGTFLEELGRVRSLGHAVDDEECEAGLRCVAAPLRDRRGDVVAALSVSSTPQRMDEDRQRTAIRRTVAAAAEISARLGWTAPEVRPALSDDAAFAD